VKTLTEFAAEPISSLQSKLVKATDEISYAHHRGIMMTPAQRVRFQSLAHPIGSSYLLAIPYSPTSRCTNSQMRTMMQYTTGAPLTAQVGTLTCVKHHHMDIWGHHAIGLNCGSIFLHSSTGGYTNVRHNVLRDVIRDCAREAGFAPEIEPGALPGMREDERGDIKIADLPEAGQVAIVDVVVATLFDGRGMLRLGFLQPGAGAKKAERRKVVKYARLEAPYHLVPFAIESYGRAGPAGSSFLKTLAQAATAHKLHDALSTVRAHSDFQRVYGSIVTRWRRQISLALARSNADCVIRAVDNAKGGRFTVPLFGPGEDAYSMLERDAHVRPG